MLKLTIEIKRPTTEGLASAALYVAGQVSSGVVSGSDTEGSYHFTVSEPKTLVEQLTIKLRADDDPVLNDLRKMQFADAIAFVQKLIDENTEKDDAVAPSEA